MFLLFKILILAKNLVLILAKFSISRSLLDKLSPLDLLVRVTTNRLDLSYGNLILSSSIWRL